jgi:rubrerythrin
MPITPPFPHQPPEHKLDDKELAKAIRLDMEAELDAVNLYSSHLSATDSLEAKKVLEHVIKEEKDHFALFTELLKKLDPQQKDILEDDEYIEVVEKEASFIFDMLEKLAGKLDECGYVKVADEVGDMLKKL